MSPSAVTLEMIGLDNIRLVKSFSFVGEVQVGNEAGDYAEDILIPDPSHPIKAPRQREPSNKHSLKAKR